MKNKIFLKIKLKKYYENKIFLKIKIKKYYEK